MSIPVIAVLVLALAQQQNDTSALVQASKDAKAKRKGSTTRVITNDDVKKADKSKVTTRKGEDPAPVTPEPTLAEKQEAERLARIARDEKLRILNETIAGLEKELARLEQSYYETNDLDYRDTVIVKRFNETRAKLDEARKQLE